jgi:phosphatidate phosphatase APP1
MNLRKHKRAYLSAFLATVSVIILWVLIAFTPSQTIPSNDSLKSGIKGSAITIGDCTSKSCSSKRVKADIAVTDANGKSVKVKTDTDGKFMMKLAPGTYTASAAASADKTSTAPSQQVTVVKDQFTRITFNF